MSEDDYQALLSDSEQKVRKAFDQVMAAKSLDDVGSAAKTLTGVLAGEFKALDDAIPPEAAANPHEIAKAILRTDVGYDTGDPEPNECGIKPTAAVQLIKAKQQIHATVQGSAVEKAAEDFKGAGFSWGTKLLPKRPADPEVKKRRAKNGKIIERNGSRGSHLLKIKNDTDSDVVVAAVTKNPKKPMASIYVRAEKSATLERLASKTYTVYFKSGTDWDPKRETFTRDCVFEKFRQSFGPESDWQIELKKRIGGNAPSDETEPF